MIPHWGNAFRPLRTTIPHWGNAFRPLRTTLPLHGIANWYVLVAWQDRPTRNIDSRARAYLKG